MASHARHARHARTVPHPPPPFARNLVRVGLTVSAGAALVAGSAAGASAAGAGQARAQFGRTDVLAAVEGTHIALEKSLEGLTPVLKNLPTDPLANTGVDPLDNGARTQVADFKPVGTSLATDPLAKGGHVGDLPVVGAAANLLPSAGGS